MTSRGRFIQVVRDAHLLAGHFLSPFLVIFGLSVLVLNHPGVRDSAPPQKRCVEQVAIPAGIESLGDMPRAQALRPVLRSLGVPGEIVFVNYMPERRRLVLPVAAPGRETTVELDLARKTATVSSHKTGFLSAFVYLHKFPGPHVAAIRGNWFWMRVWRVFADATVYGLLLISITGIYLWALVRSERRAGLLLTSAGAVSLFGVLYALCR